MAFLSQHTLPQSFHADARGYVSLLSGFENPLKTHFPQAWTEEMWEMKSQDLMEWEMFGPTAASPQISLIPGDILVFKIT